MHDVVLVTLLIVTLKIGGPRAAGQGGEILKELAADPESNRTMNAS